MIRCALDGLAERIRRQSGVVLVMTALMLPVFIGMVGFGVDFGWLFWNGIKIQHGADAASLAGVIYEPDDRANAYAEALKSAAENGYDDLSSATVVDPTDAVEDPTAVGRLCDTPNWNARSRLSRAGRRWPSASATACAICPGSLLNHSGSMKSICRLRAYGPVCVCVVVHTIWSAGIPVASEANPAAWSPSARSMLHRSSATMASRWPSLSSTIALTRRGSWIPVETRGRNEPCNFVPTFGQ